MPTDISSKGKLSARQDGTHIVETGGPNLYGALLIPPEKKSEWIGENRFG
jgi:hypothetical protein